MALEVAYLAHFGQRRRSGEPYITHPVEVAMILARSRLDEASIISGLLHDVVEDTPVGFDEIGSMFGCEPAPACSRARAQDAPICRAQRGLQASAPVPELCLARCSRRTATVQRIVEGETKVSKLPKMVRTEIETSLPDVAYQSSLRDRANVMQKGEPAKPLDKVDEQAENLRSMFVAMAEDWRIVVVKLADRLHNMRTLEAMPPPKRVSIARETLEIFAPLAHRLGMWCAVAAGRFPPHSPPPARSPAVPTARPPEPALPS
eukprot:5809992-Prymnesium_polylepis.1